MSVKIARVSAGPRLMDGGVDCAPVLVSQLRSERPNQPAALIRCQLWREKHEPFATHARITAESGVLHGIPEGGAVLGPRHVGSSGQVCGQNYFLVGDVPTIRVVVNLARSLVENALTGAIRGSFRGTSAFASREMPGAEKVGRHRASGPCDTANVEDSGAGERAAQGMVGPS